MIELVFSYRTSDGRLFSAESEAQEHEAQYQRCKVVGDMIPETDLPTQRYKQHDKDKLLEIMELINKLPDDPPCSLHPEHWAPCEQLEFRMEFFDLETGREYQQPYWARHPHLSWEYEEAQ